MVKAVTELNKKKKIPENMVVRLSNPNNRDLIIVFNKNSYNNNDI